MKKQLFIFFLLILANISFAQETNYKEYSYSEFFDLIANEKDSVFHLNDAIILYNAETDSMHLYSISQDSTFYNNFTPIRKDTIHIYKEINLNI